MPNQANHLASLHFETEIIQYTSCLVIPKADLLKGHSPGDVRHWLRIRCIGDIRLGVHHLKHALRTRKGPRKPVRNTRHPLKWAVKLPKVEEEEVERSK